jgi:hypothetical protein
VGDFVANGSGAISSGAFDLVSPDPAVGIFANQAIGSGSGYTISQDGRGQASLVTANGTVLLDFALQSASHGLVTEYDTLGSGSGTIDLAPGTVAQTALTNLTFGLSGTGSTTSFSTAGSLSLDPTGLVTSGVQDFNQGGTGTPNQAITPTSSFITLGSGTSPGTAQLVSSLGIFTYDVYVVDSTHLKLIEVDGSVFTSGDAYAPATALPSGTLAFTLAGFDQAGFPVAAGGLLPTSTSGAVTGGVEDFNDSGAVAQVTGVTGSFSALTAGRSVLTLSGLVNGAANAVAGTYTFAAYPITSNGVTGVQLMEIDTGIINAVTAGNAYPQSSTALATSQGYVLNLSGINLTGSSFIEEDDIAEFTTTSSAYTGIVDLNDEGGQTFNNTLRGTYTIDGTGRGVASDNFFNFNFYAVNSSTFLVLETDAGQVGTGIFELQGNGASPGKVQGVGSMLRPPVSPHLSLKRK